MPGIIDKLKNRSGDELKKMNKKPKKRKPVELAPQGSSRKNRGNSRDTLSTAGAEAVRRRLANQRRKLGQL